MFRKKTFKLIVLAILIILFCFTANSVFGEEKKLLEVHFIDVGQGDSILLHSSAGTDILIDGGYPENGRKLVIYLRKLGIKELDLVIGTHPHADHIGGLIDVIEGITVKEVIDPGVVYSTGIFETYLTKIRDKKIPFRTVLAGDTISTEDSMIDIDVLAPYEQQLDYGDDVNDVSIVLKVICGNISFLLMGDAGHDTEDLLIWDKRVNLKSTILKVGHHGSRYSTGDLFIKSVKPEVAVIQVGENDYGHPTDEVLNKLLMNGIKTYRNDIHGNIIITTDGFEYDVKTEKKLITTEDKRVNINKAPMGDIIEIPGMTYDIAGEIVQYREYFQMFLSTRELLKLKSMTPEILKMIEPYIKLTD